MTPADSRTTSALRRILAVLPDDPDGVGAACSDVGDWGALLESARTHGVGAFVLAGIRRSGVPVPFAVTEHHERLLLMEDMRQEVLRRTLADVARALDGSALPYAVLKGPPLAARLYERPEMRPSTDLDVLVAPASLDDAARALAPLGYALESGARGRFFREQHHHVHLAHPTLPMVELHHEAYRGFGTSLPAEPLLSRRVRYDGGDVWVLAPEDEWVYLAVHGASHRFERLSWLLDLSLFGRAYRELHWDIVASRADAFRVRSVVALAVHLLAAWLGTDIGDHGHLRRLGTLRATAAESLARPRVSHVADAVTAALFAALVCEPSTVARFGARYVRVKALHEMPLRVRSRFWS